MQNNVIFASSFLEGLLQLHHGKEPPQKNITWRNVIRQEERSAVSLQPATQHQLQFWTNTFGIVVVVGLGEAAVSCSLEWRGEESISNWVFNDHQYLYFHQSNLLQKPWAKPLG